jgi:catechol 2,3-dioxygenase-like lactoylglutathione lyase family enzyme
MTLSSVAVVSVPVSDQARAKAFYVDKLGFDLVRDDDSVPGFHWIQVAPRNSLTSITLVNWFDSMPAGSIRGLVLHSDDLLADYDLLVAAGVEFDGPPEKQEYASLETVIRDPDGNRLILQQP